MIATHLDNFRKLTLSARHNTIFSNMLENKILLLLSAFYSFIPSLRTNRDYILGRTVEGWYQTNYAQISI